MTIAAIFSDFSKNHTNLLKLAPNEIENTIKSYAKQFGAPPDLREDLATTLAQLFKSEYLTKEISFKMEKKYEVIMDDAPESKLISKTELDKLKNDPETLFIKKSDVFFKGKRFKLTTASLQLLKILLENSKNVISYTELDKMITGFEKPNEKWSRNYMNVIKHRLCKEIPEIEEYIGVDQGYFLKKKIKYCMVVRSVLIPPKETENSR